jgi:BirA family transcriptional regulator, biotin operon repressor / biotin---[acetyl-CoA-carboxylase] ligase
VSDLSAPAFATERLGRRYHFLSSCRSTNDEAAQLARALPHDETLLVVADTQTGGRGRQGRSWHSPPGENLYLSLVLRPQLPAWMVPPLTLLVGAVAAEVLEELGVTARLKWPNDVLLPSPGGELKKVAGILTEMATEGERVRQVVVGVGINVNGESFPPELAHATSLRIAAGRDDRTGDPQRIPRPPFDRGALLAAFVNALEPAYDRFRSGGPAEAIARWRPRAALPRRCRFERGGETLEGEALDVDDEGALIVRDATGAVHRISSGEVL